jgi:RHS repeat-associated protein
VTESAQTAISLPQGGGALKGIGEKFSPDLFTGTGNFSVPIALPQGRNGFQPQLVLTYSTGNGNGPFGLGWSLGIPGVSRKTSKGIPRYRDKPSDAKSDVFILSGAEDLVPVDGASAGAQRYRPRTEGLFALIDRFHDGGNDYWKVQSRDGLISTYGTEASAGADPAVVAKPADRSNVFAWRLSRTEDPFGNAIEYEYLRDRGDAGGRDWDQLYLRRIRYVDYTDAAGQTQYLVSVTLLYDGDAPPPGAGAAKERPDPFSEYRSGFEVRTRRRCKWIAVTTHPTPAQEQRVRAYELVYLDEREDLPALAEIRPLNEVSLLSQLQVIGYDGANLPAPELPPLDFSYSRFEPRRRTFSAVTGRELPAASLANPDFELVGLFGNGLPDILEMNGTVRYWRNLGGGEFDMPRAMREAPAGLRFADRGVQLIDGDGDGRTDLLVTTAELSGYYSLTFSGGWDRRKSFHRYRHAPSFDLEEPEVRLVDLDGDGVTDAIRANTRLDCYFNDPREGWQPGAEHVRFVERPADGFPANLSDPRVKWADMSGDGLQDVVLVHNGRVEYWPSLGYGDFGARVTMRDAPRLPPDYDPRRLLIGDIDGDGLADIVYVENRHLTLWINHSGNGFSAPIVIHGTPPVSDMDGVRLVDLLGSGVGGVLWTQDARLDDRDRYFFFDFTGGVKPYLLTGMDNNLGAVTQVEYVPSTREYLRDQVDKAARWRTPLPFPVQVVSRVEIIDEISQGKLTTEYRYHHGYWDGAEREFRGFGMVDQLDTESFARYGEPGLHGAERFFATVGRKNFSPPTLTKTWFHQGPVGEEFGDWEEEDYSGEYWTGDPQLLKHTQAVNAFLRTLPARRVRRDALRALRGSILRSELYALDGSDREDRPYTVTERAYALREEEAPTSASPTRLRIFFPFGTAQRTTQWERGDDPLTQFSFSADYDDVGQPRRQTAVACPSGWRALADTPAAGYLATLSHTEHALAAPGGPNLRDRVARSRSFEIAATAGKTVLQLAAIDEGGASLRLIGESLNYYDRDAAGGFGAFTGLPLGQLGDFGALVRTETLVMTHRHLQAAYGAAIPPYLTPGGTVPAGGDYPADFAAGLPGLAGYVYRPASANNSEGYFAVVASRRCDFHDAAGTGRGLTLAQRDPLGHESTIDYDDYQLLPRQVTGPTGLTTKAQYDYRVLQPRRVTDPNGNVSEVSYSPTGLISHTWVLGKPWQNKGDVTEASVRIEYGLRAFYDSKRSHPDNPQPVYARAIRRVFHDGDPDDTAETIEAREYSDGFGRLLQTRTQGETKRFGDALFGGGNAVLPADQFADATGPVAGVENTDTAAPNVSVSGWQRYDNKGRVIEKYEPFYDTGWSYQPQQESRQGRHVTIYYDPRGQAVRTVNPDGSEQLVIYGVPVDLDDPPLSPSDTNRFHPTPWKAYTYDPNDNAGRTHPGQDPHTRYTHHYNTPASIEIDALGRTVCVISRHREPAYPDGTFPPIEEHVTRSTYDIQGNVTGIRDALGRLAFQYVYDLAKHALRTESIDAGQKRFMLNAAGNPIESRDAKGALGLHAYDAMNRPTHLWARDGANDAADLRELVIYDRDPADPAHAADHNLLGKVFKHHDEAGVVTVSDYDFKGNILSSTRQVLSDEFMLGDYRAHTGPRWNLRAPRVDWAAPPANLLDATLYRTNSAFDALNRVKWSEYPEARNDQGQTVRYRLRPDYNRAGALERVDLEGPLDHNDQGPRQPYVQHIAYTAKGQRTLILYGNGLMTRYAYDDNTFRLARLHTGRFDATHMTELRYTPKGAPLQDIGYWYDLAGNIISTLDLTPGCGVAGNLEAILSGGALGGLLSSGDALLRRFDYNPLYRLTSATGRECEDIPNPRAWSDDARCGYDSGNHGTPTQDNAPDLTALYREDYAYDAAGNMLTMRHKQRVQQSGTTHWATVWSRNFGMDGHTPEQWRAESATHTTSDWANPPSNRLTHLQDRVSGTPTPPGVPQSHAYDANGNMISENTTRHFEWDHADRMKVFRNQVETSQPTIYALYLYDSSGQRVKKLVVTGTDYRTTTYLGAALEHHALCKLTSSAEAENFSLHVMDDKSRIAIKRVGKAFDEDGAKDHPMQYHLGDHLGSSALVVSGSGAWMNREEYFPYGETSFGSFGRKRYRLTGKERDEESGLNYHGARYCSPWLARWTSADQPASRDGPNAYRFVGGNPIAAVDPDGRATQLAPPLSAPAAAEAEQTWMMLDTAATSAEAPPAAMVEAGGTIALRLTIGAALIASIYVSIKASINFQNEEQSRTEREVWALTLRRAGKITERELQRFRDTGTLYYGGAASEAYRTAFSNAVTAWGDRFEMFAYNKAVDPWTKERLRDLRESGKVDYQISIGSAQGGEYDLDVRRPDVIRGNLWIGDMKAGNIENNAQSRAFVDAAMATKFGTLVFFVPASADTPRDVLEALVPASLYEYASTRTVTVSGKEVPRPVTILVQPVPGFYELPPKWSPDKAGLVRIPE